MIGISEDTFDVMTFALFGFCNELNHKSLEMDIIDNSWEKLKSSLTDDFIRHIKTVHKIHDKKSDK